MSDDFHDMYFVDAEDGYIFTGEQCLGSCVLMTRDGGRSWQSTALPPVAQLIAGGDHVYALSQSTPAVLLRSAIGSDRWTSLRLPVGASSELFIAAEGPTVGLLRSTQPELAPAPPPRGQL